MVLIWEGLYHTLHEVLLSKSVLACDDNLQDSGQNNLLVDIVSDTLKTAQSDDVLSNGDSELVALALSLVSVLAAGQVLESHPQAVHFAHVL